MKIFELYAYFFDENKIHTAYESEQEYIEDLMSLLDIYLKMAYERQNEDNIEPLSGMPYDMDHIERIFIPSQQKEYISKINIKNVFTRIKLHINERLESTKDCKRFKIQQIIQHFVPNDTLLLLFLMAYAIVNDRKYERIFAYLQGDQQMIFPTFRLCISLRMIEGLNKSQIIKEIYKVQKRPYSLIYEMDQVDEFKYTKMDQSIFLVDEVYQFIKFSNEVIQDIDIAPIIRQDICQKIVKLIELEMPSSGNINNVIHIFGPKGIGKCFLIDYAAQECHRQVEYLHLLDLEILDKEALEKHLNKIHLKTLLNQSIPCIVVDTAFNNILDGEMPSPLTQTTKSLLNYISKEWPLSIWISEERSVYLNQFDLTTISIELPILNATERIAVWHYYAKDYQLEPSISIDLLSNQYILTTEDIQESLRIGQQHALSVHQTHVMNSDDIRFGIKQRSHYQLGHYADKLDSVYTWDDIVIKEDQKKQMDLICSHIKFRDIVEEKWGFHGKNPYGRGTCALFYGAPGTGKTMAVQVLANELGLDLYRIDLSQLVSKYIGETEKNITSLFKRAKNLNALLFFDEADSLFAKRTEVKDSKDKHANAETAHLLQKLEDYEGITILATNYVNNIDQAFKRRIKFMVKFSFPTADERLQLWQSILPRQARCDEVLDFEFLANQFELSGSQIKEILNNAAFMAASDYKGITNQYLVEAIKLNYAKYGQILTDKDFGYLGEF